jgi:hypothetical protein
MRAGLAALSLGYDSLAEQSFDTVLLGIEQVYADNEGAAQSRSVWHKESVKDFKGEPYERVMAYYYRGLLYLKRGDWENAQASFKGGVLQDGFSETERYRSDVASLIWLEGWSNRCRGNDERAKALFTEAMEIVPDLTPPQPGDTVLVVAETGQGPSKFAAGQHLEKLTVREGAVGNLALVAKMGENRSPMAAAEDLFFQATTRGGRAADGILAEKAGTKSATQTAGQAAAIAGAFTASHGGMSGNRNQALVGLGIALAGVVMQAAANAMETAADTRTWDNLPHTIHLRAMPTPAGSIADSVDLLDPAGRSVIGNRAAIQSATLPPCSIAWIGANAIVPSAAIAPPTNAVLRAVGGGGGNCRTSTGTLTLVDAATCQRIGGQVTAAAGGQEEPAQASGNCRTSTGAMSFMDPDNCRRIGGQPLF